MDLTGQHLGKYELLELVGKGGMAYVYKAYQPTVDRYVAVKVLHSHLAEDGQFLERFKREAKSLGSLRHAHIVNVIDFDVHDGWYYIVMDYIKGGTLQAMLDRRGQLPVQEALRLTSQLADALDYAHRHERIHRDVKPGNVMFADEAQQHAVITDFGLTRLLDKTTITLSGTVAGTPAYMSPEAAQAERVDGRADIYSLGVILFEMVTGQRPYGGETPLSVIMKLMLEPLPSALSLNPDLPPAVDAIISKATAREPQERYQTAAEFQEAIEKEMAALRLETGDRETANGQSISGQPGSKQPLSNQPVSKTRLLPYIVIAGLLLVALIVGSFVLDGDEGQAADPTSAPTTAIVAGEPTAAEQSVAPEATPEPAATPTEAPAPTPAGSLRFGEVVQNNLRPYTLLLEDVPAAPGGSHYQLWFDIAGRPAPHDAGEIPVQNGRITYSDALADDLATTVTGVRLSLEPDFDDDPSISADVVFTGTVDAGGLAEIHIVAAAP
jgi:serine/threonine protein kinase